LKVTRKIVSGLVLLSASLYLYTLYQSTESINLGLAGVALFAVGSYLCVVEIWFLQAIRRILPFVVLGGATSLVLVTPPFSNFIVNSYYAELLAVAASWLTAFVFAAAGVHVQVVDNLILAFPNGSALSVGPICGGAYSSVLFVLLSIVMVADLGRGVPKRRIALALALGMAGANLANIFRITTLATVMYVSGLETLTVVHQFAGYAIFLAFMSGFWLMSLRWLSVRQGKNNDP